ncbi:unnamed protein product, partial [Phaeothamnion confervicola]
AATEATLAPQTLQEAFAREVVAAVRAVHARAGAAAAATAAEASPDAEPARWEQLEPATVAALASAAGAGWALQDGFLGEEWAPLLLHDATRLTAAIASPAGGAARRMQPVPTLGNGAPACAGCSSSSSGEKDRIRSGTFGEIAWLEPAELADAFPALHELVTALHGLPFELNRAAAASRLRRPLPGATMLLRLGPGCRAPPRLDSRVGDQDTGHRVTCVYFIGSDTGGDDICGDGGGGLLRFNGGCGMIADAVIEPKADRIMLFRSEEFWNERAVVQGPAQFAVVFWMHGEPIA